MRHMSTFTGRDAYVAICRAAYDRLLAVTDGGLGVHNREAAEAASAWMDANHNLRVFDRAAAVDSFGYARGII